MAASSDRPSSDIFGQPYCGSRDTQDLGDTWVVLDRNWSCMSEGGIDAPSIHDYMGS